MDYTIKTMLTDTPTLCLIVRFIGLYDGSVFVDGDLEVAIRIMTTGGDWKTNRCLCAWRQWRDWLRKRTETAKVHLDIRSTSCCVTDVPDCHTERVVASIAEAAWAFSTTRQAYRHQIRTGLLNLFNPPLFHLFNIDTMNLASVVSCCIIMILLPLLAIILLSLFRAKRKLLG